MHSNRSVHSGHTYTNAFKPLSNTLVTTHTNAFRPVSNTLVTIRTNTFKPPSNTLVQTVLTGRSKCLLTLRSKYYLPSVQNVTYHPFKVLLTGPFKTRSVLLSGLNTFVRVVTRVLLTLLNTVVGVSK